MVLVLREIMMSAVGVIVLVAIMQTLQVVVVLKDLVFVSCILLIDQTKMTQFLR